MGDVDYGYGDDAVADYGYGDDAPADYGYGDDAAPTDYGYGDGGAEDYGYGDAAPEADYGYGDAAPDADPYGYGDAAPEAEYGYGDEPAPMEAPKTRPKRRCSVTRFSIEAEACDKPLDYGWQGDGQPPAAEEPVSDEKSSAQTESTIESAGDHEHDEDEEGGSMIDKIKVDKLNMPKKGMMSRIRKRLSIM